MPLFSIVVPCHNAAAFLGETLDSCLAQTVSELEIVVVDDGSSDESTSIARAYAGRDGRVHLVEQDNQGVGAARNRGLAAARGEFVNFLDADDLLEPAKLARQGQVLAENPALGMVLCDGAIVDRNGQVIRERLIEPDRFAGPSPLFDVLFRSGQFPPHVPLLRRQLAVDVGGFCEAQEMSGWADTHFWMRVALACPRYYLVPERLCRYRVYAGNMSSDAAMMERAAVAAYASVMGSHAAESAGALRRLQGHCDDLIMTIAHLQGANARAERERTSVTAVCQDALDDCRADGLEALLLQVVHGCQTPEHDRPLVIWGAGSAGRTVAAVLRALGGRLSGWVDSDQRRQGTAIDDVPVRAPGVLDAELRGALVLVASQFSSAIEPALTRRGLAPHADYLLVDVGAALALARRKRCLTPATASDAPEPGEAADAPTVPSAFRPRAMVAAPKP